MATKWKSFTRSSWTKAVCWLVLLGMSALIVWQSVDLALYLMHDERNDEIDGRILFQRELPADVVTDQMSYTAQQLLFTTGADDISRISKDEIYASIYNAYTDAYYDIGGDTYVEDDATYESGSVMTEEELQTLRTVYPATDASTDMTDGQIDAVYQFAWRQGIVMDEEDARNFKSWMGYNRGVYEAVRQQLLADAKANAQNLESVISVDDYDYYVNCSGSIARSIGSDDTAYQTIHKGDYAMLCTLKDEMLEYTSKYISEFTANDIDMSNYAKKGDTMILGLRLDAYHEMQNHWAETGAVMRRALLVIIGAALLALAAFVMLCIGAGHHADAYDNAVYLSPIDHIWTEVQWILWGCAAIPLVGAASFIEAFAYKNTLPQETIYALLISTIVFLVAMTAVHLLSQLRRIKNRQWLNGFICWRIARDIVYRKLIRGYLGRAVHWLAEQFHKSPLRRRVILICVLAPLLCALWLPIPFIIAGLLYVMMRRLDAFERVADGAHDIASGKAETKIIVGDTSTELRALADDLNSISDGLQSAVDTAVKSERLKSELISNVSHDIKTPLTGIITYIDLLKQCDLHDETARDYLETLDQKAQRLRVLILDLFDASKASSGAMTVELARTDFDALLWQAVGERSEHLQKAALDLRIQSTPETYVRADGRLLWRILDNLLSNCARYAQHGSRVYITIRPEDAFAVLTMKNISAAELNISADELMQRFTRGDRSRHTEGSGLGLSIAQSLAQLMGGSCTVEVDGDLFKAIVRIPKWSDDTAQP